MMRCPICNQSAAWEGNPFRPFCSERCKLIDLDSWLEGRYRISAPQPGDFRWATITEVGDYDLVARLEAQVFAERRSPAHPLPVGGALVQINPGAAVPLP